MGTPNIEIHIPLFAKKVTLRTAGKHCITDIDVKNACESGHTIRIDKLEKAVLKSLQFMIKTAIDLCF